MYEERKRRSRYIIVKQNNGGIYVENQEQNTHESAFRLVVDRLLYSNSELC